MAQLLLSIIPYLSSVLPGCLAVNVKSRCELVSATAEPVTQLLGLLRHEP
jgi:hypothetical protein